MNTERTELHKIKTRLFGASRTAWRTKCTFFFVEKNVTEGFVRTGQDCAAQPAHKINSVQCAP